MTVNVAERRLELLKMEGNGFNQAEIVKHLSQKFQCCDRTVYRDFEKREEWQPALQHVGDQGRMLMKILNRYEQVYRHAGFMLLQASHENAKLGALKIMVETNKPHACILLFENKLATLIFASSQTRYDPPYN